MKTDIEKIVKWMNKRKANLFGGKLDDFDPDEDSPRIWYHQLIENIDGDGETYYRDDWEDFDFNDLEFLTELAKAKWENKIHDAEVSGYEWEQDECPNCNKRIVSLDGRQLNIQYCRQYYLQQWVIIEDLDERIHQIAEDLEK